MPDCVKEFERIKGGTHETKWMVDAGDSDRGDGGRDVS
jgi:hypothetical protein